MPADFDPPLHWPGTQQSNRPGAFAEGDRRPIKHSPARVAGEIVQVLDHDDVLLPGAIATMISAFDVKRIHCAIGQADDLMPDGSRKAWDSALPFGVVPRTASHDRWSANMRRIALQWALSIRAAGLRMGNTGR
jgi:hypothetical protein